MEKQYYVPTVEEFHVSFEFERKGPDGWGPDIWRIHNFSEGRFLANLTYAESIRVKHLDSLDIKSLGWAEEPADTTQFKSVYHLTTPIYKIVNGGTYLLVIKPLCDKVTIKTPNFIRDGSGRFDGYITKVNEVLIKNKSELKKLMNQFEILPPK